MKNNDTELKDITITEAIELINKIPISAWSRDSGSWYDNSYSHLKANFKNCKITILNVCESYPANDFGGPTYYYNYSIEIEVGGHIFKITKPYETIMGLFKDMSEKLLTIKFKREKKDTKKKKRQPNKNSRKSLIMPVKKVVKSCQTAHTDIGKVKDVLSVVQDK